MFTVQKDTIEQYHSTEHISSSQLAHILTSPKHFLHARMSDSKKTRAFDFGSLVHDVVLEGTTYVAEPDFGDQRKKENKEAKAAWMAENQGVKSCSQADWEAVQTILENIEKNSTARNLVKESVKELSHYYTDATTGQKFKCRPDGFIKDGPLWDLKTTSSIHPTSFKWDIQKFNYDMRLAFYYDGLYTCGVRTNELMFIAVENKAPYDVVVCVLGKKMHEIAGKKFTDAVDKLSDCLNANHWPGVCEGVIQLD